MAPKIPGPIAEAVRQHGHHKTILGLVNRLASERGWMPAFPDAPNGEDLPLLPDLNEVGEIHQMLLAAADDNLQYKQGSYYTPEPLAAPLARITLEAQFKATPMDDPYEMRRRLIILDPASGAGIFLALCARAISDRYVRLLSGEEEAPEWARRHFVAELAYECIFGIDLDPVATDLSKAAVWLEGDGSWSLTLLDENIITGDTLNGDEPPRFTQKHGGPTLAEAVAAERAS